MENKNILLVIDELGALIEKYKSDIKYKDYEIDSLKKKIESIENYINFYAEEEKTNETGRDNGKGNMEAS